MYKEAPYCRADKLVMFKHRLASSARCRDIDDKRGVRRGFITFIFWEPELLSLRIFINPVLI